MREWIRNRHAIKRVARASHPGRDSYHPGDPSRHARSQDTRPRDPWIREERGRPATGRAQTARATKENGEAKEEGEITSGDESGDDAADRRPNNWDGEASRGRKRAREASGGEQRSRSA